MSIRLTGGNDGVYEVIVEGPQVGAASGEFSPPFDADELNDLLTEMARPRKVGPAADPELPERARAFGEKLMDALIDDDSVRDLYRKAVDRAKEANEGLRIALKLPSDLMNVPWELLCDQGRFLSHSVHTPVVRSLDLGMASSPHELTGRLTVLVVTSQPDDQQELNAKGERESLERILRPLEDRGLVRVRWLERATLEALARESHGANVIHYIGHGEFDDGRGSLLFEEPNGSSRRVLGNRLASLLQDERSLRLVVLNSCEGARTSERDPFSGVATSLLNVDIPAVIAMQFAIADSAALEFSKSIYEALAESLPIDAALARARRALLASPDEIAFATPVLFLQRRETQLFRNPKPQAEGDAALAAVPAAAPAIGAPAAKPEPAAPEEPPAGGGKTNLERVLEKVNQLEGTLYDNQKKTLLREIREDETLFCMLRCGIGAEMSRATILVLTSARAIAVRESMVSNASARNISWQDVFALRDEGEALRLDLRDGSSIKFTRIKGSGISLSERATKFDSAAIAALAAKLAAPSIESAEIEDRAEFNRQRLSSLLGNFTAKPAAEQKNALLEAVGKDEELVAICRCAGEKGGLRSFLFLLTSKRLITCRQKGIWTTTPELLSLPWSDVSTVNTRDSFLDFVKRDGEKVSFSRFNEGEACDDRDISFDPASLRRTALELVRQNA